MNKRLLNGVVTALAIEFVLGALLYLGAHVWAWVLSGK